jgi:hypothetical protein
MNFAPHAQLHSPQGKNRPGHTLIRWSGLGRGVVAPSSSTESVCPAASGCWVTFWYEARRTASDSSTWWCNPQTLLSLPAGDGCGARSIAKDEAGSPETRLLGQLARVRQAVVVQGWPTVLVSRPAYEIPDDVLREPLLKHRVISPHWLHPAPWQVDDPYLTWAVLAHSAGSLWFANRAARLIPLYMPHVAATEPIDGSERITVVTWSIQLWFAQGLPASLLSFAQKEVSQ